MFMRKLMVSSGLTLCALAMHTASAQNYQGWSSPEQWGYGGGMPQMPPGMPPMPYGMPQVPYGMPQVPYGMPQGMPQMPQGMPMQPYGSSGFQRSQAVPYQNPWPGNSMPYETGYQSSTGQMGMSGMQGQRGMSGMSGMSGMQGQPGMSGMSGMSGMQGQPGMSGMSGAQGSYEAPTGQFPGRYDRRTQGGGYSYPAQ